MKLKDLPIDQDVIINSFNYKYKGLELKDPDGKGKRQCYVFYSEQLKSEKLFLESTDNKIEFKNKEGRLIL